MYLSIMGLSVWAVWGLYRLAQWRPHTTWIKYGLSTGIGVILIGFIVYSNVLTRKWENSDTVKQEVREYLQPTLINETQE